MDSGSACYLIGCTQDRQVVGCCTQKGERQIEQLGVEGCADLQRACSQDRKHACERLNNRLLSVRLRFRPCGGVLARGLNVWRCIGAKAVLIMEESTKAATMMTDCRNGKTSGTS